MVDPVHHGVRRLRADALNRKIRMVVSSSRSVRNITETLVEIDAPAIKRVGKIKARRVYAQRDCGRRSAMVLPLARRRSSNFVLIAKLVGGSPRARASSKLLDDESRP